MDTHPYRHSLTQTRRDFEAAFRKVQRTGEAAKIYKNRQDEEKTAEDVEGGGGIDEGRMLQMLMRSLAMQMNGARGRGGWGGGRGDLGVD